MKFVMIVVFLLYPVVTGTGCKSGGVENKEAAVQTKDIDDVMKENTELLMSTSGVVGVYIGAFDDGTKCIVVMVVKRTAGMEEKIPMSIEGFPVRIEETGEIKPMKR